MAPEGVMRQSKPVLLRELPQPKVARSDEEKERAAAKVAAETAQLVVGARVEGRYQASLPGVASDKSLFKKTHWFPGMVHAIDAEEKTYAILYDDGDYEEHVRRRFIRLMRPEVAAQVAAEEEGLAQAAFDELELAQGLDSPSALPHSPGFSPGLHSAVGLHYADAVADCFLDDDELPNDYDDDDDE